MIALQTAKFILKEQVVSSDIISDVMNMWSGEQNYDAI